MSNKDPRPYGAPQGYSGQINASSQSYIMQRIDSLEQSQLGMLADVENLDAMYSKLQSDVEILKKGGWSVDVGPFQDKNQARSEKAKDFGRKLDQLETLRLNLGASTDTQENNENVGETDQQHSPTVTAAPICNPIRSHLENGLVSIPPHLRRQKPTNGTSTPTDANNPVVIDGNVDQPVHDYGNTRPVSLLTPPLFSPIQPDVPIQSIEDLHLTRTTTTTTTTTTTLNWVPMFIKQLAPLHPTAASFIPPPNKMRSFSADFLRNLLGGTTWSPGLKFIIPKVGDTQRCIIANRSYYTLDMRYEPYLPKNPGEHGAKLSPFFNVNPEDEYRLDEGCSSFDNVPMFVMMPDTNRYIYFGNYSQTRWSDKLDYERMVENVPQKVKEYWSEELSAVGRPEWVTEALRKHFFPKPLYEGSLFGSQAEDSVNLGEESKHEEEVEREVRAYIQELKAWSKDVKIKMNWINKEYILNAFEGADADEPAGLRLWWEYLQCVHWNRDFYDMLVTLQSRNRNYD